MSNWNRVRTKRTPIRDIAREWAYRQKPSPCIVRQATPEECERYGMTAAPGVTEAAQQTAPTVPTPPPKLAARKVAQWEHGPKTHAHVTKEFVVAELHSGKNLEQIEREQVMATGTLAYRMRKWGIRARDLKKEAPTRIWGQAVQKELVLAELAAGKNLRQIEEEHGMGRNTLSARLRKWGIDRKEVQRT